MVAITKLVLAVVSNQMILMAHASYSMDPSTGNFGNDAVAVDVNHRLIMASRTETMETADLNCFAGRPFDPTAPVQSTTFEYWYAVENKVNRTEDFLSTLESLIFTRIKGSVSWCYQKREESGRKLLSEVEAFDTTHHRRLGIMSFNSGPRDVATDFICPTEKLNEADACFVMQGKMSIMAHETDDLEYTIASARDAIEAAMNSDSLLSSSLPTVTRVAYLGDSEDEVFGRSIPTPPSLVEQQNTEDDKDYTTIIAVSVVSVGLLAGLFLLRKRRMVMTQRDIEAQRAASKESTFVDTEDLPGSFHQGYYHYTRDGVRYLSTQCGVCLETQRQLAMGGGLETISEDEVFDQNGLISANSRDLGLRHSAIDVHVCGSAICECNKWTDPSFVSSSPSKSLLPKSPASAAFFAPDHPAIVAAAGGKKEPRRKSQVAKESESNYHSTRQPEMTMEV